MADPTIGLTFQDLIIRVAEFLGLADYTSGPAAVPISAHDLDLCQRLVNDGYRRFVNSKPNWNWATPLISITLQPGYGGTATSGGASTLVDSSRTEATGFFNGFGIQIWSGTGQGQVNTISTYVSGGTITVGTPWTTQPDATSQYKVASASCVDGDNSRYYMPDGFYGSILMPWTYPSNGPRKKIVEADDGMIRGLQSGGTVSGDPVYVAVRPLGMSVTSTGKRWEAVFWPAPSTSYIITARARLYPDKLVNLTDRHIAGFEFDEAILACALAQAERQRNDEQDTEAQNAEAAISRAIAVDQLGTARRLGDYGDKSDSGLNLGRRPTSYYQVDSYNGVST